MNAHSFSLEAIETFHIERSRCIDAFAQIEENVISILGMHGVKCGGEPFAHKLEALQKLKAGPQFSRARLARLLELEMKCQALNALRNDLVHSRMQIAIVGGETKACFINTRQCVADGQTARLFSLEALSDLHRAFARTAVELNQVLINPVSSPPPPSPGAKADP